MKRAYELQNYNPIQPYQVPFEDLPNAFQNLPTEVVTLILLKLRDSEIFSPRLVCKFWEERTVTIALQNILEIRNFVNFLNVNLKPAQESQKAQFFKLHASAKNLISMSPSAFHFGQFIIERKLTKEHLFKILMSLTLDDITRLRAASIETVQLNCFEHSFDVAQIYKRIELMDKMPFNDSKSETLRSLALDLAVIACHSEKPKDEKFATVYLLRGLRPTLKKESSREAITTALIYILYTVKYDERHALCQDIAQRLSLRGEIDLALHLLSYFIRNETERNSAYENLAIALTQMDQTDGALKVTKLIEAEKSKTFY